eukprot:2555284-Pleurochrysis_carterae.AAC.1
MYEAAQQAMKDSLTEQNVKAFNARVAERSASKEVNTKISILEAALKKAVADLHAARDKAREQEQLATVAATQLADLRSAVDTLESSEKALGVRAETAEYQHMLAERRELRAKESLKAASEQERLLRGPASRSEEDWESLSADAERKARSREVLYIRDFLESRSFRACDLCSALHLSGHLDAIWGERELNKIYYEELRCVMAQLEHDHFGERFGLHLHYEAHLTLNKILEVTQAACKTYDP